MCAGEKAAALCLHTFGIVLAPDFAMHMEKPSSTSRCKHKQVYNRWSCQS